MNIIVKPNQVNLSSYLEKKIDYFLLPLEGFSVESTNFFSLEQITNIRNQYPNIHLFIGINKNIMNNELESLKQILLQLESLSIEGVFYYDVSLIKLKRDLNLSYALVWDQTHMVTNYKTCDYYYHQGVSYALLSKEITKDEILTIMKESSIKPIVELLSYPSVAFSKRKLITNYFHDLRKTGENTISLLEKVSNDRYYAYENQDGTTFFKDSLVQGCLLLEEFLNNGLKYILLREDFIDHDLFLNAIDQISYFIHNYQKMSIAQKEQWIERQNKLLGEDFGFFFQKTIYKVK